MLEVSPSAGKLSSRTALHADGSQGAKWETSSERGVQGGEGSSRTAGAFTAGCKQSRWHFLTRMPSLVKHLRIWEGGGSVA